MSNYFCCQKCGGTFDPSRTYCPNCDGAVVMEQQTRIAELESEVERLRKRIEIISKAAPDPGTLRNMLRAMQNGEMTVSRGVELIDMWLAGNYSDDMLPPVREGLGEDEMPWDRIDKLTAQNNDMHTELNTAWQRIKTEERRSFRDQVVELEQQVNTHNENFDTLARISKEELAAMTQQRDELLALVNGFHRKLETYRNVYSGDKELRSLLSECEAAIAKVKP